MKKMIVFKSYLEADLAENDISVLNENNIPYEIEDNTRAVQDFLIGMDTSPKLLLKLFSDDFLRARQLLSEKASENLGNAGLDYYLYSFDNDELLEIVQEQDSWDEFDVQLAKKILTGRGIEISETLENTFKEKRIKDLSKKEKGNHAWIVVGYISSMLGGLLGIIIGIWFWKGKRTLPNGKRMYIFEENARIHGLYITITGIAAVFVYLFVIPMFS